MNRDATSLQPKHASSSSSAVSASPALLNDDSSFGNWIRTLFKSPPASGSTDEIDCLRIPFPSARPRAVTMLVLVLPCVLAIGLVCFHSWSYSDMRIFYYYPFDSRGFLFTHVARHLIWLIQLGPSASLTAAVAVAMWTAPAYFLAPFADLILTECKGYLKLALAASALAVLFVPSSIYAIGGVIGVLAILLWPGYTLYRLGHYFDWKMVCDAKGIHFPRRFGIYSVHSFACPWDQILQVSVVSNSTNQTVEEDPSGNCSLLFSCANKNLGTINCGELARLTMESRIQLLETLLERLPERAKSPTLNALLLLCQNQSANQISKDSFTTIWEQSLVSKIGATAYDPLLVGASVCDRRYVIQGYISSGGQATTYMAQDSESNQVVLKEYFEPRDCTDEDRERIQRTLLREYNLLKQCDFPGLVKVIDQFSEPNRHYLVLEHIEGMNLRKMMQMRGQIDEARAIEIASQLARCLSYLHSKEPPILHRDLSPENIVLDRQNKAHLVDFGAALEVLSDVTGTAIGKQAYVAPEQFRGKACTASDIYGLGCCIYFMLTGQDPTALSTSYPKLINCEVSADLDNIVTQCTAFDAKDRFVSADEVLEKLNTLCKHSITD